MTQAFGARVSAGVAEARAAGLLRTLETRASAQSAEIEVGGRRLVNFTSNDYLGLAAHPRVVARVTRELANHGFGAGAAALLSGRSSLHEELEQRLVAFTGAQAGLLFSSGYLANTGALPALIGKHDFVAHDRLNHASLIDGVIASGARHRRYAHASSAALPQLFAAHAARDRFIVSESVFSMDGDVAPLGELATQAVANNAVLYVDDAHGFGVTGAGRGAAASLDMKASATATAIIMLTFGKALGSIGAIVLASPAVIEFLVQRARTFIYDTALPPVCAAAALEALDIIVNDPGVGQRLLNNVALFKRCAAQAGLGLSPSDTPIQPVPIGDDHRAVNVAAALVDAGFYVRAIRPPTVPRGSARLRITLRADHTAAHIRDLVAACATLQSR